MHFDYTLIIFHCIYIVLNFNLEVEVNQKEQDFGLGEALAGLIDALVDRREEWIKQNGSEIGLSTWCAEQVNGVK